MRWLVIVLVWWCGTSAVPAPGADPWKCPEIAEQPSVECSCDMPHTLRCTGDKTAMQIIGQTLRSLDAAYVSLLDCTVQNVTSLPGNVLRGVALHGLVISSGEIVEVHRDAFEGFAAPLQALGLPNNKLTSVPTDALENLPELDRLDLSSNRMKSLDGRSFSGLKNLSFVELSDNAISKISEDTFSNLPQLRTLRLRGNHITMSTVSELRPLRTIEELDLSGNNLVGPIRPKTFPKMSSLKDIQLAHNSFSSIKMGAMAGLPNLTTLSLHHNQIDVLEDHAFMNLTKLVHLDLAHNRIVAVSGGSLAHLTRLVDLDLRHNFLRALTADLILPLKKLQNLKLDENDISIIASDALKNSIVLKRLTLADNPLNCDCSLMEFAVWLANSSLLKQDKESAVCATPPPLENALVVQISIRDLVCGEDFLESAVAPLEAPIKAKINLLNFSYDGRTVSLQWSVENKAIPYICDAIFVYEEEGQNEVLLESNTLKCNSSNMVDPTVLNVTVPDSSSLITGHKYRYCVVLLGSDQDSDDMSLVLGCSEIIPLIRNMNVPQFTDSMLKTPRVLAIQANLTSHGALSMDVTIYPAVSCGVNVAVFEQGNVLDHTVINCTKPRHTFVGLHEGPYKVCANVIAPGPVPDSPQKPRCVTVHRREIKGLSELDAAFVSIFLALTLMVVALIWGARKLLLKPKVQTHQCFMPPEMDGEQQHNRYVKLQATTKL